MSKRIKWSALRKISCKHLQTQTVAQSASLMFGLHGTHAVFLPLTAYRHSLRFQTHPLLCGLCIWRWCFECERPVGPWDSLCHITWYAHKQNHQNWLEQFGHFTRGLKCIQLSFQTLSTHSKPLQALSFQSRQTCSTSFTVGQAPQVVRSHANMVG